MAYINISRILSTECGQSISVYNECTNLPTCETPVKPTRLINGGKHVGFLVGWKQISPSIPMDFAIHIGDDKKLSNASFPVVT